MSVPLGHPAHKHLVELIVHFFEALAFLFEQTTRDGMLGAGRGNIRFVVDNNKEITDIVFVIEV